MAKGWKLESKRHAMSANGIKTGRKAQSQANMKFSNDSIMFPSSGQPKVTDITTTTSTDKSTPLSKVEKARKEVSELRAEKFKKHETLKLEAEEKILKKQLREPSGLIGKAKERFEEFKAEQEAGKVEHDLSELEDSRTELAEKEIELDVARNRKNIRKKEAQIDAELEGDEEEIAEIESEIKIADTKKRLAKKRKQLEKVQGKSFLNEAIDDFFKP